MQIYVAIPVIIYSLIFLASGSLTEKQNKKVKERSANGYSLYKWANKVLEKDDIILTTHRSVSYRFDKSIHFEFIIFKGLTNKKNNEYINQLINKKPKYILTYGYGNDELPRIPNEIKNCTGKLKFFEKEVGKHAVRNPFKRHSNYYNGYIYEFKYYLLPNCIN